MPGNSFSQFNDPIDLIYSLCAVGCVSCGALAAGMTVGLLSLDKLKLQIKLEVGTLEEKASAKKILPVIADHHLLLCTLLLFNAAANESLPIFLDAIVPSWAAVVLSVTLVLLFGEIVPSALFTGPNQLFIAGRFVGLVYFLEILFYPIAYPMSKVLDKVLGHDDGDDDDFGREEISALVKIILRNKKDAFFKKENKSIEQDRIKNPMGQDFRRFSDNPSSPRKSVGGLPSGGSFKQKFDSEHIDELTHDEVNVITGVLGLSKLVIRDVCIPIEKVVMLSHDQILDQSTIDLIDRVGHSRLPVFQTGNSSSILGYVLVKRLININPEKATPLKDIPLIEPLVVGADHTLLDVLGIFQRSHAHMAIVSEQPQMLAGYLKRQVAPDEASKPIGVITVEDVFEAMLQTQIYDEDDFEKESEHESASNALRELSRASSMASSPFLEALNSALSGPENNGSSRTLYNPILNDDMDLDAPLRIQRALEDDCKAVAYSEIRPGKGMTTTMITQIAKRKKSYQQDPKLNDIKIQDTGVHQAGMSEP